MARGHGTRLGLLSCAALVVAAAPALAQVAPGPTVQVPSSGRVDIPERASPAREQVETPIAPPQAPKSSATVEGRGAVPAGPCPLTGSDVHVLLHSVSFEAPGGGPVNPALAAVLAPITHVEGGDRPVAVVCEIRDRANQALSGAGYVASVQIPPQEISSNSLRLVVVSAHITEVRVTGASDRVAAEIAPRIRQIKALDPLNEREAEHILLLANDVPGLSMRMTLRPAGTGPGDVVGELTVTVTPVSLIANYQNTGSRQLGPSIFSARGEVYGITGLQDRTYISASNSAEWDEVHILQAGHDMGIGSGGARIGINGSYAWSNPSIPNLDLRSRSLISGLDFSAPIFRGLSHGTGRTRDYKVYLGAGFELLNQRTVFRQAGVDTPFQRDRLRVFYARAGGHLRVLDASGVNRWDVDGLFELRKGADILNATPRGLSTSLYQPTRLDGDPEAFEVRATLNQTIQPLDWLAFDLSVFGQWSNHALLNLEEFTIGNLTYGRGYDPGANGGDRAAAVHLEPRVRLPIRKPVVELTGFYDAARIWNLDTDAGANADRSYKSAGGGVRITWPRLFMLEVTYAKPIDKVFATDEHLPRDRVLVTFTTQFLPWRAGK